MENKYIYFKECIKKLDKEESKNQCEDLICLAQRYFSVYEQCKNLEKVHRKLANIYQISSGEQGRVTQKKTEMGIRSRLLCDFYGKAMAISYGIDDSKREKSLCDFLKDYELDIPELIADMNWQEKEIGGKPVEFLLRKSCCQANRRYQRYIKEKRIIPLGMENIREAVEIYLKNRKAKSISKEESFNNIFSEECVIELGNVMQHNEALLPIYLTPIRTQLCNKEEGGRTINNQTWKRYFEKDYRMSLSKLEKQIQAYKQYDIDLAMFVKWSMILDDMLENIKK